MMYPTTRKAEQVDIYHGVSVEDPYRWLEDDRSPETAAWVKAQNEITFDYLNAIPEREQFRARLTELWNYPRHSAPSKQGSRYFYFKNDGLQNQSVLYRQKGPDGQPELLIDPNTLSPDGTTMLVDFEVSKDGRYGAYGISRGGSDWHTYHVMDLTTTEKFNRPVPEKRIRRLASVYVGSELEDALASMRRSGAHIARVFNSDGATTGMLFLEDIIEELVGEVEDATSV